MTEYGTDRRKIVAFPSSIPYYAWDNRQAGEMLVWLREG
jgi:DUF1680 family protein